MPNRLVDHSMCGTGVDGRKHPALEFHPMISPDSITKLRTSVVYVTSISGLGADIGLLLGADPIGLQQFIDAPQPGPSASGGIVITSMRNQLIVNINQNVLEFDDGSDEIPSRPDFAERVAGAADYIARQSNQSYTAIGLNFQIEAASADGELPSEAVLRHLVRIDRLTGSGLDAIGASARFWYTSDIKRYDLRIEPRGNQYESRNYFAALNVHMSLEGKTPSHDWLSDALVAEYKEFVNTLIQILEER